ncbi:hypothetical protein [Rhodococcoides fascians]|nr:hypothetical protein [Rhodococcus fascians]
MSIGVESAVDVGVCGYFLHGRLDWIALLAGQGTARRSSLTGRSP